MTWCDVKSGFDRELGFQANLLRLSTRRERIVVGRKVGTTAVLSERCVVFLDSSRTFQAFPWRQEGSPDRGTRAEIGDRVQDPCGSKGERDAN